MTEDQVETVSGKKFTYSVVRKKQTALIIPWDGERLTLVGQYRYPVSTFSWEFPHGHCEHVSVEETARGELREEAGLTASLIKEIAEFNPAPGMSDQKCHVFLATGLTEGETDHEDSEEGMEVRKVTANEFKTMIAEGIITDGPTIAAFGIITAKKLLL